MKKTERFFRVVVVVILCITAWSEGNGQTQESGFGVVTPSATSAASYYFISKPGELTMPVNIWGYVRNPGRYEIPTSTDLVQLISYAGGPIPDADLGEVKITRQMRGDTSVSYNEIVVDVDNLKEIKTGELVLHPGDTIYIDRTGWSSFRDALSIATTVATIATAVTVVIITTQNSSSH
jgi:hypothetical protein